MSDENFDYDLEGDVTLDVDEKNAGGDKEDWLKLTAKNQILRVSFVYFHTYDHNAVSAATKAAKKAGKSLPKEEIVAIARKAITARATELNKSPEQLTVTDKLDIKVAHFKSLKAHYQDGFGYAVSRLGKDGPEADAVWKRLPDPKPYFTTLLLVYPTNEQGVVLKEEFAAQVKEGRIKLMRWRFSNNVYEGIWKLNDGLRENTMSLASQDIKLECKEPKYQNIQVSFVGKALWQMHEGMKQMVLSKAVGWYDKLIPFREMTTDQLRAKLGMGGSAVADVSSDNFQDLLDNV
jgi:hypothetical protein